MSYKSELLQLRHDAHCLAAKQETILRKLKADCEWFDELLIHERDLNDSLARAVSAASETYQALDVYARILKELDSRLTPPEA